MLLEFVDEQVISDLHLDLILEPADSYSALACYEIHKGDWVGVAHTEYRALKYQDFAFADPGEGKILRYASSQCSYNILCRDSHRELPAVAPCAAPRRK